MTRMDDAQIPRNLLDELLRGTVPRGNPVSRWTDGIRGFKRPDWCSGLEDSSTQWKWIAKATWGGQLRAVVPIGDDFTSSIILHAFFKYNDYCIFILNNIHCIIWYWIEDWFNISLSLSTYYVSSWWILELL